MTVNSYFEDGSCLSRSRQTDVKERRERWLACLSGEDRNSVYGQITRMIWNAAAFKVINEARKFAHQTQEGDVQLNALMHGLVNETFFESQAAAIRRLTDKSPLGGVKGVCSLRRLVLDMQADGLFTRGRIFDAEGLKYDFEDVKERQREYSFRQIELGNKAFFLPPDLWWRGFEIRHEQIDRLALANPDQRSRGDTVRVSVFSNLLSRLDMACGEIGSHVDKFIAHAATPESRAHIDADSVTITFGHLWRAHQTLCEVTHFVSVYILGSSSLGFLAIPGGNPLAYIERPLVSSSDVPKLEKVWQDFEEEAESWTHWGLDELDRGMPE